MSWALIDDGISNHPKFLAAGPAAGWLWLCGVTYCRRHHTRGFIPAAALSTLGVPAPRPLMLRLIENRLWQATETGWLINGYEEFYGDETAEKAKKEGRHPRKVEAGRKGGLARAVKQTENPQANFLSGRQQDGDPVQALSQAPEPQARSKHRAQAHSVPIHSDSTSEERSASTDPPKPHPIRDFLALHESLFAARFGQKPPKYSGRDAKIAAAVIDRYGPAEAEQLLELFLKCTDEFVLQAGFGLPVFESRVTRLVMDRAKSKPQTVPASWSCPHVDRCGSRSICANATFLGRPERQAKATA